MTDHLQMTNHLSSNRRRLASGLIVLSLGSIGAACGGDESDPGIIVGDVRPADTADTTDTNASSPQPATPGIEVPEGLPTADSLLPELGGLPVPDGAVFAVGSAYDAETDPRQTAVQQIFLALPVAETVAFYLGELPAAGYEIVSDAGGISDIAQVVEGTEAVIMFNDPDGLPGQIFIRPGSFSETQLNVNLFRGGTR